MFFAIVLIIRENFEHALFDDGFVLCFIFQLDKKIDSELIHSLHTKQVCKTVSKH